MTLRIATFSNATGGNSLFKALGHPLAAPKAVTLVGKLVEAGPVAIYDPLGLAEGFAEFHDLARVAVQGVYVQDVEAVGRTILGHVARPVTDLAGSGAALVFVVAFDSQKLENHIAHLVPRRVPMVSLDAMRIPEDMLTDHADYLSKFNWATNFGWLRDEPGRHTRIVSANYWTGYGAKAPRLWARLMDADGAALAEWTDAMPPANGTVTIDSRQVRARFGLGDFCGSLFLHVIGAAGHDVVKYALDTFGESDRELSGTHDANAWPADLYAGLPAPKDGETVLLWIQNSHPLPIPPGTVGLSLMGHDEIRTLERTVAPFATTAVDVAELFPDARWPDQFEVHAGKHFVRPRYEVITRDGRRRIAHTNVERVDLEPDPTLATLGPLLGKGCILPAPVLPPERWRTILLPTPMSTAQAELPVKAVVHDASGRPVAEHRFGNLKRSDSVALDVTALLDGTDLPGGWGHVELMYDFDAGDCADGWLHAMVRYENRESGHTAETSFGSHIFNTALTYRNEPQSYLGPPPGLSTRLFLRLGPEPLDTFCHLIYPASTPWHDSSDTTLVLTRRDGTEVARRKIAIPCSGSRLFSHRETFTEAERAAAGENAYILVRDTTCRLFGYHGCLDGDRAFSLDHMFGF
ncbi:MAG TPA: hypothetical protein VD860_07770 [Azospirillum sp.]|nr:hypothetical protein [Azospirillum sp.]